MIDLHSHILPGIDDGAKDEEEAVKLLQIACESGISKITFTSHFNCEKKANVLQEIKKCFAGTGGFERKTVVQIGC